MRKIIMSLLVGTLSVACGNKMSYDSVDAAEFAKVVADQQVQIIDTRTPAEFAEGHIPGAINIDLELVDFDARIDSLDKSRPVAVYCRGGRRSKIAAERIVGSGYLVTELEGGLITWEGEIEK